MNWKEKLSSRKLWAAIVGVIMGVAMVFGLDESTITDVAGAVVSIVSLMTYIITEGKIDAAAADKLVGIDKVIEIVNDESEEVGE
jgi:uncharacterized membrane protein